MKYYFKCPNCGSNEQFVKPSEQSSSLGCLILILGGFLPALLLTDYKWQRVQCLNCMHIFRQPPLPGTALSHFALWIAFLTAFATVIGLVAYVAPSSMAGLPAISVVTEIELALAAQPREMAYVIAGLVSLILASCLVAAIWSKAKFRRELAEKFQLWPLASEAILQQKSRERTVSRNPTEVPSLISNPSES